MATKLGLYRSALRLLGSQRISALTDDVEGRYLLDDCYDEVLAECLEAGQWNFAIRSQEIASASGITPTFGYSYAFVIPADLVRLAAISAGDTFEYPLERYSEEVGYWWADVDPLYVAFVSSDNAYGGNLSLWPASYTKFVYSTLAERICMPLTQSDSKLTEMVGRVKQARTEAKNHDAMGQPSPTISAGSWVAARGARIYSGQRYRRA